VAHWHAIVPTTGLRDVELRSRLTSNRIARVVFFVAEGRIGLVHGFIKKTQKTPPAEIALARRRMKEMMQ
jgi:phage-related protein